MSLYYTFTQKESKPPFPFFALFDKVKNKSKEKEVEKGKKGENVETMANIIKK